MRNGVQLLPVVVGITLCTASAAIFYKWYKSRNQNTDQVDGTPKFKFKKQQKNQITKVESTIPNDKVPLICGRYGANIKSIEEQTATKIQFCAKDDLYQVCEITGKYENVMKAAKLIKAELDGSHRVTDEMIIPTSTHKRICRQSAKILRDICQQSSTSISIDPGVNDKNTRRLLISGSTANIQRAKRLIEDTVRQDIEEQELENKREPRYVSKGPSSSTSMESLTKPSCMLKL